ncbi:response regulator [Chenggangzhangella methanolivorans]|uniref:TackOD1 domain-containing metal-binding protein n=1 Tax=Chenggangzhangella methanolivorans TaxID=1437009 RepID=UPI00361F64D2
MSRRILLVEDDGVTVDVVAGLLAAKGFDVDVATDGVSGVEKLCKGGYALALIDYHLPEIDGYASARVMGQMLIESERPKLVALTADPASLKARGDVAAVFDALLPKPFEPKKLLALVEELIRDPGHELAVDAARQAWIGLGLFDRPRAFAVPPATPAQALALRDYFELVDDLRSAEALLLLDAARVDALAAVRRQGAAHLIPAIDLTGARARELDASFRPNDPASWSGVADALRAFCARAETLTVAARCSAEADLRLMAQLHVSGRALEPTPDPAERLLFVYQGGLGEAAVKTAERLVARGLMAKNFAERFHVCEGCASHRLNVREECGCCRSPDMRAVKLLRHHRCGAVAHEDDFRAGGWFACPKCEQMLKRYGEDYSRAGEALRCGACGAANGEAAIGFLCLDCGAHADSAATPTEDVHAYALTSAGTRLLTSGDADAAAPRAARAAAVRFAENGRSAVLAELRFRTAERVIAAQGWDAFETLRRLFLENLAVALGEDARLLESGEVSYLVVPDIAPEDFAAVEAALVARCAKGPASALGPRISILEAA